MSAMKAWTFSQIEAFQTCPKQFYHIRVARDVKEPVMDYQKWGEDVHTALENRVKDGTPLPDTMKQWTGIADKIRAMPGTVYTEQKMAVDANFQPVDYWSPKAWTRGMADVTIVNNSTAAVLDYKTGKRKLTDQLYLYAAYTFAHHPEVEVVHSKFIWLKDKTVDSEVVHKADVPGIWQKFLPAVNKLRSAHERGSWPANPSGLCKKHCAVMTCEFNGRRG